jgi:hypothetical protein
LRKLSDHREQWRGDQREKTLGSLVHAFGDKRFTTPSATLFSGRWRSPGRSARSFAPPFSGLDTLPALGVVVLSLSILLEDGLVAFLGTLLAATGITLEPALAGPAVHSVSSIL